MKASVTRLAMQLVKAVGSVLSLHHTDQIGKASSLKDASKATSHQGSVSINSCNFTIFSAIFSNTTGTLTYGEFINGKKEGKSTQYAHNSFTNFFWTADNFQHVISPTPFFKFDI